MAIPVVAYSQLRAANRRALGDALPLAVPFNLNIETTNICNFRCRMCPVSFEDYSQVVGGTRNMELGLHRKIIAELATMGGPLKCLKLYGEGEPFWIPT